LVQHPFDDCCRNAYPLTIGLKNAPGSAARQTQSTSLPIEVKIARGNQRVPKFPDFFDWSSLRKFPEPA